MNNSNGIGTKPGRPAAGFLVESGSMSGAGAASGILTGRGQVLERAIARCVIAFAGLLALLVTGCEELNSSGPPPPVPPDNSSNVASGPVKLAEGDVVKLFFPGVPEYNSTQKIRTDGKLSLPLIGEVHAAGRTLAALQADLTARYKPKLQNAEVVVSLETSGTPVIISGAVASPGKFVLDRRTTLLEAIMGAGGFTDYARKKKVRLIRVVNGQYQTWVYDMSGGLTGKPTPLVYVKGGDLVHVPLSNW
jgi:polysaccharide biosynthesis/export protein